MERLRMTEEMPLDFNEATRAELSALVREKLIHDRLE